MRLIAASALSRSGRSAKSCKKNDRDMISGTFGAQSSTFAAIHVKLAGYARASISQNYWGDITED